MACQLAHYVIYLALHVKIQTPKMLGYHQPNEEPNCWVKMFKCLDPPACQRTLHMPWLHIPKLDLSSHQTLLLKFWCVYQSLPLCFRFFSQSDLCGKIQGGEQLSGSDSWFPTETLLYLSSLFSYVTSGNIEDRTVPVPSHTLPEIHTFFACTRTYAATKKAPNWPN